MSKQPVYNQTGLQRDNKSHVLYALASKQMELKQIQDEYEAKISKIKLDLVAIETTMCLFDWDCSETIKKLDIKTSKTKPRTRNILFKNGELKKLILTVLRTSIKSLKTDEITANIMNLKELDIEDKTSFLNIQKSIHHQLKIIENSGLAYKAEKIGLNFLWKIKD